MNQPPVCRKSGSRNWKVILLIWIRRWLMLTNNKPFRIINCEQFVGINPIGNNVKWEGKYDHWMLADACDLV